MRIFIWRCSSVSTVTVSLSAAPATCCRCVRQGRPRQYGNHCVYGPPNALPHTALSMWASSSARSSFAVILSSSSSHSSSTHWASVAIVMATAFLIIR